jgi:hypothetical protein
MTQWYDFNDANAVEANPNEVDPNEVVANEANPNPNKYLCDCGCNLEFIEYKPGFDISVGNKWLITNNAMVEYSWRDYILLHEFNLWQDFQADIILNYNDIRNRNNEAVKPEDAPWIHLYNREVAQGNHIPLNEKMYYEYVY